MDDSFESDSSPSSLAAHESYSSSSSLAAAYESYSSPSSLAAYSAHFFSTLTFDKTFELDYPMISPSSSLASFVFGEEIPCDAAATVILPGKVISHVDDVLEISSMWRTSSWAALTAILLLLITLNRLIWVSKISVSPCKCQAYLP